MRRLELTPKEWQEWEKSCKVPPVRLALVNLNKPTDLAHAAQIALASIYEGIPHIGLLLVGQTLSLTHDKVVSKVTSWGIERRQMEEIPTMRIDLSAIKSLSYRMVATVPTGGTNALSFRWEDKDVVIIGGANGLSKKDLKNADEKITVPSGISFLTTPSVIPIVTYNILQQRHLWNN